MGTSLEQPADPGGQPLSFAQSRLWFLDQFEHTSTYNVPLAWRLSGDLDCSALIRALDALIGRHEVLRTTFPAPEGVPVQSVRPPEEFRVERLTLPDSADAIRVHLNELMAYRFRLAAELPFRAQLIRLGEAEWLLVILVHHIVFDSWSEAILAEELGVLYEAFSKGQESPLPPLPLQYGDYARQQRSRLGQADGVPLREESYWRSVLAEAPTVLELPFDHPRPHRRRFETGRVQFRIRTEVRQALVRLGREHRCTLFMVLHAGLTVLLSRWSGSKDVLVGTPFANRTKREVEGLIGFFVNMLVLRMKIENGLTVSGLLTKARKTALEAYAHQDLPFERLVELLQPQRLPGVNPFFQVSLVLQKSLEGLLDLSGLEVSPIGVPEQAKFDLTFFFTEMADGLLAGECEYDAELFDSETIERMVGHLDVILEAMTVDPSQAVAKLPLLTVAEHAQLQEWNATDGALPTQSIHELIAERAARSPDAPALIYGEEIMTHSELDARANQLARHLVGMGIGPEKIVGLYLPGGFDLIVGLLAILKSGGAFLPLDPANPVDRTAYMVADAGAAIVITNDELAGRLAGCPGLTLVNLDDGPTNSGMAPVAPPAVAVAPDGLAYVTYTSGSTGRPKGVAMHHRPVVNLINWHLATFGASRRTIQFTSIGFDISNHEIFTALAGGGALVLVADDDRRDPVRLVHALDRHEVNSLFLPFSVLSLLAVAGLEHDVYPPLTDIFSGGETIELTGPLPIWLKRMASCRLHNHYGLTETHVIMSHTLPTVEDRGRTPVPIGSPMTNVRLYVLDTALELVPAGVSGELYVGGLGQARCYWNRPDLTAARYVPSPFGDGERLCRTGDLVRRRSDGELEFLGRADQQVKLRGFRIELGEIEATLLEQPGIALAAVQVREDRPGDRRLVAYLIGRDGLEPDPNALRDALKERLPEYMVPQAFVILQELPLTSNGKLDRKALPAPSFDWRAGDAREACNERERALAAIFAEVLGVHSVGVDDDFFALGGHSLLATQVISRVRTSLRVEVPLRTMFDHPTVAELAAALPREDGSLTPLYAHRRPVEVPLSFAQSRLWFLDRLDPLATYNIPMAWRLNGDLDAPALQRALADLVERHETLRTTFPLKEGEPVQVVESSARFAIEYDTIDEEPAEIKRRLEELAHYKFDLTSELPFRARLLQLRPAGWVLALLVHHIAFDGWSERIFVTELAELYAAARTGRSHRLEPISFHYADFALWQRQHLHTDGGAARGDASFWLKELEGAPLLTDLPLDRQRSLNRSYQTGEVSFAVEADLYDKVEQLARARGATPFIVLHAALAVLLSRLTGGSDVLIGTPVANRTRSEVEPLIGFFVNTLVLRLRLDDDPLVEDLLDRARDVATQAFSHQDLPFERLVELLQVQRIPGVNPLFQVMLVLQNAPREEFALEGVTAQALPTSGAAKFDLTFLFADTGDGGLAGTIEYDAALFDESTVKRMAESFRTVLAALVADSDLRVSNLSVLTQAERRRLLVEWNDTAAPAPRQLCLHQLFDAIAAERPDALALTWRDEHHSYRSLAEQANRLAHHLITRGVGPDSVVGLCLERSPSLIVAMLAVLKAGGAFLPLDPRYPPKRLDHMLTSSGAGLLVTSGSNADQLGFQKGRTVRLDAEAELIADCPSHTPAVRVWPENLAYVMYTSGSTGEPKGVAVTHRNVAHYARGNDVVRLTANDVVLQVASFAFDGSTIDIWGSLLNGARLVLYPYELTDPRHLAEIMTREAVTFTMLPTGLFHAIVEHDAGSLAPLKSVLVGGDVLLPHAVRKVVNSTHCTIINGYGPTEATVCTTHCVANDAASGDLTVPIGRPMANARVYLLGAGMEPVPIGATGELFIGGEGLAQGYIGDAAATAARFVPDPFGPAGGRLYRTGDLARYRADGQLEFVGRVDRQVKVRGFRIEPAEIEAVIAGIQHVDQAVVLAPEGEDGERHLKAYVAAGGPGAPTGESIECILRSVLPEFMVPSTIAVTKAFPLNQVGKVDHNALLALSPARKSTRRRLPRTQSEQALAIAFAEVLGVSAVFADDNFFVLGGHSLRAVKLSALLAKRYGIDVPLAMIFKHQNVASIALALDEPTDRNALLAVPLNDSAGSRPLFMSHPVSGTLTAYMPLAQSLTGSWSVHGLQSPLLTSLGSPPQCMADLALAHAAAIQRVQPTGPYVLAGWSFGGLLALATAEKLAAAGGVIERVVALDSALGADHLPVEELDLIRTFVETIARSNGAGASAACRLVERLAAIEDLKTAAAELSAYEPDFTADGLEQLYQLYCAHIRLAGEYKPQRGDIPLTVVLANDAAATARQQQWIQQGPAGVRFVATDSDHYDVLRTAPLAEILRG